MEIKDIFEFITIMKENSSSFIADVIQQSRSSTYAMNISSDSTIISLEMELWKKAFSFL